MRTLDVLMYFILTASATATGLCYWMAVQNMHRKGFKVFWVFIVSLLITPFGAWIVSLVLKEAAPPDEEAKEAIAPPTPLAPPPQQPPETTESSS
jgi:hypothetical protein